MGQLGCVHPGPGVDAADSASVDGGLRRVRIHRLRNHLWNVGKTEASLEKRRYRDLVGRIQHDRQAALRFEGPIGQAQAGEVVPGRLVELERLLPGQSRGTAPARPSDRDTQTRTESAAACR